MTKTKMWRVPCRQCGATFCLFEAERWPRSSEVIDWSGVRNLAGRPVQMSWRAVCCSCECEVSEGMGLPETWILRTERLS